LPAAAKIPEPAAGKQSFWRFSLGDFFPNLSPDVPNSGSNRISHLLTACRSAEQGDTHSDANPGKEGDRVSQPMIVFSPNGSRGPVESMRCFPIGALGPVGHIIDPGGNAIAYFTVGLIQYANTGFE
jgi:hypothetical protein